VAPPSTTKSRPGRALVTLLVLIVALLLSIVGKNLTSPGDWQHDFKVQLGLDLSSGTTVTLRAETPNGQSPTTADMATAISIMESRVNHAGFSGATVQQQGTNIITVSVPGKGSNDVVSLVGTTAQLRFRQVLLYAPNKTIGGPASPTAPTTPTPAPTPSASSSGKAKAKASPKSSGQTQALGASRIGAKDSPSPSPSSSASPSPASSASPSPAASASPSPSSSSPPSSGAGKPVLSTVAVAQGDPTKVSKPVQALFDKLNCADPNWQKVIYNNQPSKWDEPGSQIVSCENIPGTGMVKYALDKSQVLGEMVTKATASLNPQQANGWQVNLSFNSEGAKKFSDLTSQMYSQYTSGGQPTSVLDQFAIVLDGKVVSAPTVNGLIPGGQAQITGTFDQKQATDLANVLAYGALPLTFTKQSVDSVSPQLGSSQLHAGLIAAGIGLLLVVLYSFLYYRGLGIVSVLSLMIAALLSYLSVVALSRYYGFSLSLSGVAGLIVAIGITADSFVVYFERLRDEVREGRSLRAAVERGWTRARRTILVSDTVSFLAAALLYYFAIGDVKGFAFTLGLTTVIDVAVVFLFTKPMVTLLARTRFFSSGHPMSGLDPARLGARNPWRGGKRVPARTAAGGAAATPATALRRTAQKEA
jgi:preprotein translocase subunit SecD